LELLRSAAPHRGGLPARGGLARILARRRVLRAWVEEGRVSAKDLARQDSLGRSALHRAAASGSADTLNAVVELGLLSLADVSAVDLWGRNVVHFAVESNDSDCTRLAAEIFPQMPPDLVQEDEWHRTPAHAAAAANATNALRTLIELGVPTQLKMGPTRMEDGAVVLVSQELDEAGHSWEIGRIRSIFGSDITVKYECGRLEPRVTPDRCVVAPTPLVLAEKLGHKAIAAILRSRGSREGGHRLHHVSHMAQVTAKWSSTAGARSARR